MFSLLVWVILCSIVIEATHFNGGIITWVPINSYDNSSSVAITITQSYSWVYPSVLCDINVPISTPARANETDFLKCVAGCSTQGNYSSNPVSFLTDCTSLSSALSRMTSQRSVNITLTAGAHFSIAFRGGNWVGLGHPALTNLSWSVVCSIDLRIRADGLINTPPKASVVSPQYTIVNTTAEIQVVVSDVNIGDDVRCRWSANQTSVDECADICYPGGLPNDTILSNCTFIFTGPVAGVWYALAIQVEDFINETSTVPMSSVPVQFLIYVIPVPKCPQSPLILPSTDCLNVQVGIPINFTLYAMTSCNVTTVIIIDIMQTVGIAGMQMGNLTNSTTNASLVYVALTWTPQMDQLGSQQFCAMAYTNEKVQSQLYCISFTVTTSDVPCVTTTIAQSTTTAPVSDKTNIAVIVIGSLLALLLSLCCACCWLYYFLRGAPAKRRSRKRKTKQNVSQRTGLPSDRQDYHETIRMRKPKNYLIHNESNGYRGISSCNSSNPTETVWVPPIDDRKEDNIRVIRVSKSTKPSGGRNLSIQLFNQQTVDQNISTTQKLTKSKFSDVTVSRVNRLSERGNNNHSTSLSNVNVNVIKLTKNKTSTFHHTSINDTSTPNNDQVRKDGNTTKVRSYRKTNIHNNINDGEL